MKTLTKIPSLILLMAIATVLFHSCKEDCDKDQSGSVRVINQGINEYSIAVDGEYNTSMPANSTRIYVVGIGNHEIVATQLNGFISKPNIRRDTLTIKQCQQEVFSLPLKHLF